MHAKRLLKLADKLETVPPNEFDLGFWFMPDNRNKKDCGATACAFGWACSIPSFKRAGLTRDVKAHEGNGVVFSPTSQAELRDCRLEVNATGCQYMSASDKCKDFCAASLFFGISSKDVDYLFTDDEYDRGNKTTPKQVAKRIRKFVRQRLAELVVS